MPRFSIRYRDHREAGTGAYSVRNYRPHAYMDGLPAHWVPALANQYRGRGCRVETGDDWIRVHGITQQALRHHVNDPLGEPGAQDPRNVQTTIKRHRPKVRPLTAGHRLDAAVREEEARHLRPDLEADPAAPSPSPRKVRSPRRAAKHAAWEAGLAEAEALMASDPGADPAAEARWLAEQEAELVEQRAWVAHRAALEREGLL